MTVLIGIHGAWAASWVWEPIREPLHQRGIPLIAVDLPGTPGQVDRSLPATLQGNIQVVLQAIASADGDVVLVGHSGGSLTATAVAELVPERVAGIIHVAGMMLPSDWSYRDLCLDYGGDDFAATVGVQRELRPGPRPGTTVVPPEVAVAYYFQMARPTDAIAAARSLVPQADSNRMMTSRHTPERAGRIPQLYIEAAHDNSLPLELQRHMLALTPGAVVATLESDHAPQLSATLDLAALIAGFVEDLEDGALFRDRPSWRDMVRPSPRS